MTSAATPEPALPPTTVERGRKPIRGADMATLAGGVAVLLSAALPWISVLDRYGQQHQFGAFGHTGDDGILALVFGALAVCCGIIGLAGARWVLADFGTIGAGGLSTLMAVVDIWSAKQRAVSPEARYAELLVEPGAGLYVLLVAGAVLCASGISALRADARG